MTDPAVEAARRVFEREKTIPFSPDGPWARDALIPAAREALAPIRTACDQLRRHADQLDPNSAIALGMRTVLDDLTKHVYPSEAPVAGEGEHGHG